MCYLAIPGRTGCVAVRNVPMPIPHKVVKAPAPDKPPSKDAVDYIEPHFFGGTRVKRTLTQAQEYAKDMRTIKNIRARNAKRRKTPSRRKTIRQVQPKEMVRKSSLVDLLDELRTF